MMKCIKFYQSRPTGRQSWRMSARKLLEHNSENNINNNITINFINLSLYFCRGHSKIIEVLRPCDVMIESGLSKIYFVTTVL